MPAARKPATQPDAAVTLNAALGQLYSDEKGPMTIARIRAELANGALTPAGTRLLSDLVEASSLFGVLSERMREKAESAEALAASLTAVCEWDGSTTHGAMVS